jgi:hypothetical protein
MNNARDWIEDKRFQDLDDKLEAHHVVPDEFLEKHWGGDSDPVVNFALLTESTNKKLRNALPKDILERPDVSRDAIRSHRIEPKWLEESDATRGNPKAYIEHFLGERATVLEQMTYDAVGVKPPERQAAAATV